MLVAAVKKWSFLQQTFKSGRPTRSGVATSGGGEDALASGARFGEVIVEMLFLLVRFMFLGVFYLKNVVVKVHFAKCSFRST